MKYLDYIFYRVTKAYMKWDGESGMTGTFTVALIITFILLDVYAIIHFTIFFDTYGNQYKEIGKPIVMGIMLTILVLCYIRYRKRYRILKKRWQNETKSQSFWRGVLVISVILLPRPTGYVINEMFK